MSIERYAWVPVEPIPDSPEKRLLMAFIVRLAQDAQLYGAAPVKDRALPNYLESTAIHTRCVTSDQFRWWCEVLGVSSWRLASIINDLIQGRRRFNPHQIRGGMSQSEYDHGFKTAPRSRAIELSHKASIARKAKAKA